MKHLLLTLSIMLSLQTIAQKQGTLYVKGGEKIIVSAVKKVGKETSFFYKDSLQKNTKTSLPNWLIDSIVMGKIDTAMPINNMLQDTAQAYTSPTVADTAATNNTTIAADTTTAPPPIVEAPPAPKEKYWNFMLSFGFELGNLLEFNNPSGSPDKKTFTLSTSIDANANYRKQGARFAMSNELHYIFGVQKESVVAGSALQKVQDNLNLLHDISLAMGKKSKWNYNTIIRTNTSLFTIYDGNYFKNITGLGKVQAFASPYTINVAPGLKYEASQSLRLSISPYSFQLYGVMNDEVAQKGIYITDTVTGGSYKNFLFKEQGAELNVWFDKQVGEWLQMQYRISLTANYLSDFTQSGKLDGLLITKFRLAKNLYLTHRATIQNTLNNNFWQPYFVQNIFLNYSKSF